jgi:hypothetical protein
VNDAIVITVNGQDFQLEPPFTNRELHLIKQIAGVRSAEIWPALEAGDTDVIVAFAHIAVRRTSQNRPSLDELWELPVGDIDVQLPEEAPDPTDAPTGATSEPGNQETTRPSDGVPPTGTSST